MNVKIDTLRAFAAYGIAAFTVIGGFIFLFLTRGEAESTNTALVIAGFIGSALTFTFGSEVQTRTAKQAATQTATAQNGHAPPP